MNKLSTKDFLGLKGYTKNELESILDLATAMKQGDDRHEYLKGKFMGMLFNSASTRTRVSFQVGAKSLGGHMEYYHKDVLQLSRGETIRDTATVLGKYLDGLVVRYYDMQQYGFGRASLNEIAAHAGIPIINALDDKEHPCQVMADILTLREKFGEDYKKKNIVLTWGYSRYQKSPGVPHSFLTAAAVLGMNIKVVNPKGFDLDEEFRCHAEEMKKTSGASVSYSNDLMEASADADVIYVKSYKSLTMSSEEDLKVREELRNDWMISDQHFAVARPGALFMNCMPFIRGEQVTAAVADHPRSVVYDEAENRLHVQKAIMASIL